MQKQDRQMGTAFFGIAADAMVCTMIEAARNMTTRGCSRATKVQA